MVAQPPIAMMPEDDSDYVESRSHRPQKRRRTTKNKTNGDHDAPAFVFPIDSLSNTLMQSYPDGEEGRFECVIEPFLDDLLRARKAYEDGLSEVDKTGSKIRPLRQHEAISSFLELNALPRESVTPSQSLLLRKLRMICEVDKLKLHKRNIQGSNIDLTPLQVHLPNTNVNPDILDAMYSIQTTPFHSSFLSRSHGTQHSLPTGLIAVDWESRTPWTDLIVDIREHYSFSHPDRDQPKDDVAPITYCTLQTIHLPQVQDLLERSFWPGIDVSDSLNYQPEKATVLAMYKKLVVGVVILKSPQETYIMYLAVKAGWDKSQIARNMLYHVITLNPHKDITLHVSVNNSAILLYNQFGFKAEEFVAGFYSKYLDPHSRLSNNAFKLRFRHLQSQ